MMFSNKSSDSDQSLIKTSFVNDFKSWRWPCKRFNILFNVNKALRIKLKKKTLLISFAMIKNLKENKFLLSYLLLS